MFRFSNLFVVSPSSYRSSTVTDIRSLFFVEQYRAKEVVPGRIVEMESAVKARDFQSFATLTIQDSNQFHACCLDTTPPIFYLNDVSKAIIMIVEAINDVAGRKKVRAAFLLFGKYLPSFCCF